MSTLSEGLTKLVESELITKEWAETCPEAFQYFYDKIGPILKESTYYPESGKIFRAFSECPPKDLKVVILGQDPYHDGSATGLAFDNLYNQEKISPSLLNIIKEIREDVPQEMYLDVENQKSHLQHLPEQGVLLLNTALTVEPRKAGSHAGLWKVFTEQIIKDISKYDNIVWILWGNHAKSYKAQIVNNTHYIIEGGHPSPLNTSVSFAGGKYFSRCNNVLNLKGLKSIRW